MVCLLAGTPVAAPPSVPPARGGEGLLVARAPVRSPQLPRTWGGRPVRRAHFSALPSAPPARGGQGSIAPPVRESTGDRLHQGPFHGGTLTEDTRLLASGSPYVITDDIIVPEGITLTIEPGVTLQFDEDRALRVEGGELSAAGTTSQPIVFTRYGSDYWGGILFDRTQADNRIAHAVIEYTHEAISNPRTHGVSAYGSRVTVADSVIRHTYNSVAFQSYPWFGRSSTVYLLRNEIYDIDGDAVHPTGGYAFIQGNHIHDISHGAWPVEGIELSDMVTPAQVLDNHIHDVTDDCIDLNHSSAVIERNELHHCGDKGISIGDPSSTTLVNNLVYANTDGIAVKDGATSYMINNTVAGNQRGIRLYEVPLPGHEGLGAGVATVVNTIVWQNDSGIELDLEHGAVITVSHSDVQGESIWPGEENTNADPLFHAPTSHDYRLQAGSPCIDTGTPIGAPDQDVRGLQRPRGRGYDRGAHEFFEPFQGGTLTEDTTLLTNDSPYTITAGITVTAGVTLTIQPDVTLQFEAGRSLVVEGRLIAVGTSSSPITFTRYGTDPWGAIVFQSSTADNHLTYATVEHARVDGHNPYWQGVIAYGSKLNVAHSTIRHMGLMGLTLENSEALVQDNVIHDVGLDGIHAIWGDVVIRDNHIYNAYEGVELESMTTPAAVLDNHIHDIADDCIDLDVSSVTIERNQLHHCGNKGVSIAYTSSVTLVNNLIYTCTEGVAIQDGGSSHIVNNTVTGNQYGIRLHKHHVEDGGTATLVNSIVWGNGTDLELYDGSTVTVTYSNVFSSTGGTWPGVGNINADPLFHAPQRDVYRLQKDSPCVDMGTPVGAPDEDIRGIPRPIGEGYDQGAYEFFEFFSSYLPFTSVFTTRQQPR